MIRAPWTVDRAPWTVHRGPWTVHRGPWTVRRAPCTEETPGGYVRYVDLKELAAEVLFGLLCRVVPILRKSSAEKRRSHPFDKLRTAPRRPKPPDCTIAKYTRRRGDGDYIVL